AVLPIALWHFNQLSTIGPIANLGVVTLAGLATILGLLAVTVAFFTDAGGAVFLDALWPLLLAMRALVTLAARVPGALVHLPAPHWTAITASRPGPVSTHDDQDPAGGSAALRREFTIGDQLAGPERIWMGGVSVLPLTATDKPAGSRRNDDALVFRVDYGAVSFLLTSDISAEVESRLIRAQAPLAVTVLKVAHHGARTSSTPPFLEKVKPALAVISVGRRNPYGHPSPDTLARLAATGARIYRTDRDGAVIFE